MPALTQLTTGECERLLRRGVYGRFALVTPRGVEIIPVNYAVHEDAVVVHTSPEGTLARHGDGADLAFEVDMVDEERWHGWSVVARGRGSVTTGADVPPARPGVRSWVDGDHGCELRLAWTELTGRRVGTGWDPEAAMYSRRMAR